MLGEAQPGAGKAVPSTKPPDLSNVLPQQYAYEGLNPIFGTVKVWEDWSGGYGQRIERAPAERENRYYYATNADLSVKGMWLKGPAITTLLPGTVDATTGVTHFFEIASTLFALNGRYVQKRTSDTDWNTGRQDFGVGTAATDVEVFYANAGGGANYAYIAMGESVLFYRFDGTTYTQHGTLYANTFRAVGRELYRGVSTNQLAKVNTDSDPWTAANWSSNNAFNVGDKASAINRLAVTSTGALLVFKTDGIYTLDQSGNDKKLFPHLRFAPLSSNGKGFGVWLNALFVPYGQALYQVEDEIAFSVREKITDVGPEKLNGNDSPVRGRITAFAGHESLHAYAAIYNGTDSYLLKLVRDEQGQFVWHGSITAAFAGVQITALYKTTIGAAANHTRLYLGLSDGTVGWFTLPNTANPAADSSYTFSTALGSLYPPTWGTATFASDQKGLQALTVNGLNLSTSNYVQGNYRTDPTASFQALGTNFQTVPWQKAAFAVGAQGVVADFRFDLVSTGASASPQVTSVALSWRLQTELRQVYTLHVLADDGLVKRDGTPLRFGRARIKDLMEQISGGAGSTTLLLPNEDSRTVAVANFGATRAWEARLRKWYGAYELACAEVAATTTYGTVQRSGAYRVGDLGSVNVAQLGSL